MFRRFGRKGYSLFACLGRQVIIGTLSVATLQHAKADGVSVKKPVSDTIAVKTDREMTLHEVSVTGQRAPMARQQAARMVTVLESKDIQAAPVQSVNDLLKHAAGVDVRQRGPIGAQTDVSIRGGNNEQAAILLNGINICDPQTGHNTFDFPVDMADIERIEILEGPAGRVYGTSSLLGAINIVTKAQSSSSLQARAEAGSYGYATISARAAVSKKAWANSLSAGMTRSDGYSRNRQGGLNADFKGAKAYYEGRFENNDVKAKWHAGLSAKDFGANTFYGAEWDNQFEHTLKTFTAIQAENKRGALRLKPAAYWNRSTDRFELYRGQENKAPYNYHRSDVFGLNLNGYASWAAGRTAFGVELRNEDQVSTNLGEPLQRTHHICGTNRHYAYGINRTNISLTVEHNIILKRLTLSAGMVAVKNSWNGMNMRVYPGADVSYRIGGDFKVFASWNTSLRMPSVTELYYSVGGHKADKYLKPEELSAVEGGAKYSRNGLTLKLSGYYNHCKNLIDWIRNTADGANAPWQSVNFTVINAVGIETSATADLQQLLPKQRWLKSASVAYHYIDRNKKNVEGIESKYSLEYLRHKLVANIQASLWRNLTLCVSYRFQDRTGSYTDTNGNSANYSPYAIWDARLAWHEPLYNVYVEANNITSKKYVDYGNVPQPGAWLIAGISLNLGIQ